MRARSVISGHSKSVEKWIKGLFLPVTHEDANFPASFLANNMEFTKIVIVT